MNQITRKPLPSLGYHFIPEEFIPKGKNEYYLRNKQHRDGSRFRKLKPAEIKILEKNANRSDDWSQLFVADGFNPALVKNCSFYGMVRIGKLDSCYMEFNNFRIPVGLYNSTIVSCDFGDNVAIDNINFMSHYIIGHEAILVNINELATTDHSKFGNGVLKEGEPESVRIWMELSNENAGRKVLPFNGMLAADAWLWSKYRDDEKLMQQFKAFTDLKYDTKRGYYGKVGERTVIKNCRIIKDVWIGSDAYIKGANKLKNLTINSGPKAQTQIGEGCELVNGIIGFGCRIFYGVKAVRFMLGHNSQLKYGARLINSYLGDNSTISCCEVLNSLIFPGHEQHHNNSFLCAATVLGQSNMAAGATIGSNHNSRGADGEIIAGRGFWPALCVSLKHNSRFASFTLIAKGDFPSELNIPIPFSLVSHDVSNNRLQVFPGYWFLHNMYALMRNTQKYIGRDKRPEYAPYIEYDFLGPDSINEMIDALALMEKATAKAWGLKNGISIPENQLAQTGAGLIENKPEEIKKLNILAEGFENSTREVQLIKVTEAHPVFKEMIVYYGVTQLLSWIKKRKITHWDVFLKALPKTIAKESWKNIGGQLMPEPAVRNLIRNIHSGSIRNWDEVHEYYGKKSVSYPNEKFRHSWSALLQILNWKPGKITKKGLAQLILRAIRTREWMTRSLLESRAKDYENPFRKMVYDTKQEMEQVLGKLEENTFILSQQNETEAFAGNALKILEQLTGRASRNKAK